MVLMTCNLASIGNQRPLPGRSRGRSRAISSLLRQSLAVLFAVYIPAVALTAQETTAKASSDSCIECHSNQNFIVTEKKLYDYYQSWRASVHGQEEISCSACHGGRPGSRDKDVAHGTDLSAGEETSAVSFQNVPGTCGRCHEVLYAAYRKSAHFDHLQRRKQVALGPNCVTCHGSLKATALKVNTVRDACQRCHNRISGNHPRIPEQAEVLLNDLNAIRGYRRYIALRAIPEEAPQILRAVDTQLNDLAIDWHTFDLYRIEVATETLLAFTREKQEAIRRQRTEKKP